MTHPLLDSTLDTEPVDCTDPTREDRPPVSCPTCQAPVGEPCRTVGGYVRPVMHGLRMHDAERREREEQLRYLTEQELLALRLCTPEAIGALMRREGFDPERDDLESYARHKAAHVLTVTLLLEGDADAALDTAMRSEEG